MTERMPPMPGPLDPEERALAARLARLGPHGEPSPALDARILAAARGGVAGQAPQARRPARWPWAFGIAASVALAVGLAWQLRPLPEAVTYDEETANVVGIAAPAADTRAGEDAASASASPAEPAPAAATQAPAAFRRLASQEREAGAEPSRAADARGGNSASEPNPQRAHPAPSPPAAPAAVVLQAPPVPEAAVAADIALPAPPPPAPAAKASAPAAPPSPRTAARDAAARRAKAAAAAAESHPAEARAAEAAAQDTFADEPFVEDIPPATADSPAVRDAWLHRIRELEAAGDTEAARASLQEFVRRYPAFPLPEDLRTLLDQGAPAP